MKRIVHVDGNYNMYQEEGTLKLQEENRAVMLDTII